MDCETFILLWLLLTLSWRMQSFQFCGGLLCRSARNEAWVSCTGHWSISFRLYTPMSYQFLREEVSNANSQANWIILNHLAFLGIPQLWLPQVATKFHNTHSHFQRCQTPSYLASLQTKTSEERSKIFLAFSSDFILTTHIW